MIDLPKIEQIAARKTPELKNLHTYAHKVADDVCKALGKPKEFGRWLGVAKRIGPGELEAKLKYMLAKGIRSANYLTVITKNKK